MSSCIAKQHWSFTWCSFLVLIIFPTAASHKNVSTVEAHFEGIQVVGKTKSCAGTICHHVLSELLWEGHDVLSISPNGDAIVTNIAQADGDEGHASTQQRYMQQTLLSGLTKENSILQVVAKSLVGSSDPDQNGNVFHAGYSAKHVEMAKIRGELTKEVENKGSACSQGACRQSAAVTLVWVTLCVPTFLSLWQKRIPMNVGDANEHGGPHAVRVGPNTKDDLLWTIRIAYVAAFFAGIIMVTGVWSLQSFTPSGMTGFTRNVGYYITDGKAFTALMTLFLPLNFVLGNFFAGIMTRNIDKTFSSLENTGVCLFWTSLFVGLSAVMTCASHLKIYNETLYVTCMATGMLGGTIKATTGFVNCIGVTGSMTDVGLIIGHAADPDNRTETNGAKAKTLAITCFWIFLGHIVGGLMLARITFTEIVLLVPAIGLGVTSLSCVVISQYLAAESQKEADKLLAQMTESAKLSAFKKEEAKKEEATGQSTSSQPSEGTKQTSPETGPETGTTTTNILSLIKGSKSSAEASAQQPEHEQERSRDEKVQMIIQTLNQEHHLDPKTRLVVQALQASFWISWSGFIFKKKFGSWARASNQTSSLGGAAIGVSELILHGIIPAGSSPIGCQESKMETFGRSCMLIVCWLLGTILSGLVTQKKEQRTPHIGAMSFFAVGCLLCCMAVVIHFYGAFGAIWPTTVAFGYLNGVVSAITGFARIGHMTGNWMNIGLLCGHLIDHKKRTPDHTWKLKTSAAMIVTHAAGAAVGHFVLVKFHSLQWVTDTYGIDFLFPAMGLVFVGSEEFLHHKFEEWRYLRRLGVLTTQEQKEALELFEAAKRQQHADVLQELTKRGAAGGFSTGIMVYPTEHNFASEVHQVLLVQKATQKFKTLSKKHES